MQRLCFWLTALIVSTALAGCGDTGKKLTDEGNQLGGLVTGPTQVVPPSFNSQAFVPQLINDARNSFNAVNTVKFDLIGNFISVENGQPASNFVRYAFQKPNKTAIEVVQSSDARTVGTKMLWEGGAKMKVHTKFVGFFVNVDVDLHDTRATDQRGYFIDETGIVPLMATLTDARNTNEFLGFAQLDGVTVARLGIKSPRSLRGISREIMTIDSVHKLPVMREMFDANNKLVFQVNLKNVAVNSALPASTFKID